MNEQTTVEIELSLGEFQRRHGIDKGTASKLARENGSKCDERMGASDNWHRLAQSNFSPQFTPTGTQHRKQIGESEML